MSEAYEEAYELSVSRNKPDLYPLLNWIAAGMVLNWEPVGRGRRAKAEPDTTNLQKGKELLSRLGNEGDPFWNKVIETDYRLIEALLDGKKLEKKTLDLLAGEYAEARKLANRRKFASVLDQLKFLQAMAVKFDRKEIAQALDGLSQRLQVEKPQGVG
jgi:hypothetical protein